MKEFLRLMFSDDKGIRTAKIVGIIVAVLAIILAISVITG